MKNCQFAYRKAGDVSLHCRRLEGKPSDYCAHQYLCNRSRKWEVSPKAATCVLRAGRK